MTATPYKPHPWPDVEALRRQTSLADAHHMAASCAAALSASSLGEQDGYRLRQLQTAHAAAVDLARALAVIRDVR